MTSFEYDVILNHLPFDCLFSSLCGPTSKKYQSPHYCEGNSRVTVSEDRLISIMAFPILARWHFYFWFFQLLIPVSLADVWGNRVFVSFSEKCLLWFGDNRATNHNITSKFSSNKMLLIILYEKFNRIGLTNVKIHAIEFSHYIKQFVNPHPKF